VAYLQLGSDAFRTTLDENAPEVIVWETRASDGMSVRKAARLPRVIFVRER
jgi:hypothetical protein